MPPDRMRLRWRPRCGDTHSPAMTGAIDLVLLDLHWRPRHRVPGGGDWRETLATLLRLDGRWIAMEQARPDGADVRPTARDIALTRALRRRLKPLDMMLADHVIRAGDARFSFRSAGLL